MNPKWKRQWGLKKKKITNPITLNIFRLIYTTIKYSYNKKEES